MLNNIDIQGRLTSNPELRKTTSGTSVCSFTVATDRDVAADDSGKKPVDFIDCVAWRGTAEFLSKYFTKGQMILVHGKLQTRSYTDKENVKRKATEIVADSVYFCGSKAEKTAGQENSYAQPGQQFSEIEEDDGNLPF